MGLIRCPECGASVSEKAMTCPHCGIAINLTPITSHIWRGFEWRSKKEIYGWPLVHIAFGRNKKTGRLLVAKGVIAIGQFAIGLITIAQFGIGILFGFGQFIGGIIAVGQFALGLYFGLGQFATGSIAIGQLAFGEYVRAQIGFGRYVWSQKIKDPQAIEYFQNLWDSLRHLLGCRGARRVF
jgi:hypothetical protein